MFNLTNNSIGFAGYMALQWFYTNQLWSWCLRTWFAYKFFSNIQRSLNEFLNPFMANLIGATSYSASYSAKMKGHIFHCVIFHYSGKILNNLSFKNERQSIRHYEVRTLFLKSRHLGPQTRQNFIWEQKLATSTSNFNLIIRSRKCIECDIIMCFVWERKLYWRTFNWKSILISPKFKPNLFKI